MITYNKLSLLNVGLCISLAALCGSMAIKGAAESTRGIAAGAIIAQQLSTLEHEFYEARRQNDIQKIERILKLVDNMAASIREIPYSKKTADVGLLDKRQELLSIKIQQFLHEARTQAIITAAKTRHVAFIDEELSNLEQKLEDAIKQNNRKLIQDISDTTVDIEAKILTTLEGPEKHASFNQRLLLERSRGLRHYANSALHTFSKAPTYFAAAAPAAPAEPIEAIAQRITALEGDFDRALDGKDRERMAQILGDIEEIEPTIQRNASALRDNLVDELEFFKAKIHSALETPDIPATTHAPAAPAPLAPTAAPTAPAEQPAAWECPFCLTGTNGTAEYLAKPCNHRFHFDCLTDLQKQSKRCPVCGGIVE